jgi:hypothetical protein
LSKAGGGREKQGGQEKGIEDLLEGYNGAIKEVKEMF